MTKIFLIAILLIAIVVGAAILAGRFCRFDMYGRIESKQCPVCGAEMDENDTGYECPECGLIRIIIK